MAFMSVKQAAEALGVSEKTIRTWIDKRLLPAVQVAPHCAIRIKEEDIHGLAFSGRGFSSLATRP